jgi:hypothetical protein
MVDGKEWIEGEESLSLQSICANTATISRSIFYMHVTCWHCFSFIKDKCSEVGKPEGLDQKLLLMSTTFLPTFCCHGGVLPLSLNSCNFTKLAIVSITQSQNSY